jgi:predicted RNase H-like HicB family nuclease
MRISGGTVNVQKRGKYFIAECPEIHTSAKGTTKEKAIKNLKEKTEERIINFFWLIDEALEGPPSILSEAVIEGPDKISFRLTR